MARKKVDFSVFEKNKNKSQSFSEVTDEGLNDKIQDKPAGMVAAFDMHNEGIKGKIESLEKENEELRLTNRKLETKVATDVKTLQKDYDDLKSSNEFFEEETEEKIKFLEEHNEELKASNQHLLTSLDEQKNKLEKLIKEEGEFRTDIDPEKCLVVKIPGRIQKYLNETVCSDLVKDFNSHIGQKEPIYLRPISDELKKQYPEMEYEVFAGTRRRWSAEFVNKTYGLNFKLKGWVKEVTDEEASLFTEKENSKVEWKDIEFGFFYWDLIEEGTYKTQIELANKRNIDENYVNRLMVFGKLREKYPSVIDVFDKLANLLELKQLWAKNIFDLLKDDIKEKAVLNKINELLKNNNKLSSSKIYGVLIESAENATRKTKKMKEVSRPLKNSSNNSVGYLKRSSVGNLDFKIKSKSEYSKADLKRIVGEFIDEFYIPNK